MIKGFNLLTNSNLHFLAFMLLLLKLIIDEAVTELDDTVEYSNGC